MLPKHTMLAFMASLQVPQCTAKGFGVSILGAGCLQSWQLPAGTGEGPRSHICLTAAASGAMALRRLQGDPWPWLPAPLSQSGPLPWG